MFICQKTRHFSILLLTCIAFSCHQEKNDKPLTVQRTDGLGRHVTWPVHPGRVMALSPAVTEMLFALVPDSHIVGVTSHCNYPAEMVAEKPRVEIYPLNIESILALRPQVIFSEEGMTTPADAAQLEKLGIPVYMFRYQKVADILSAMDSLHGWLPKKDGADKLLDSLHQYLGSIENEASGIRATARPKMLAITWIDPIFAYGFETWMTDKMRLAGGINVLNQPLDKPYPTLQRETVLKLNPDILFGGTFEKLDTSFFRLYPELKRINAYKNRKVFELRDDLVSRPSPRFAEGIEEMRRYVLLK